MKTSIIAFVASLLAVSIGCDKKPDTKPVEVNAPGVNVKVDPEGGVNIKTPGVVVETK
jgi:hypothetical protein